MRKKQGPFEIPNILESLAADVVRSELTMEQAAEELCRANRTSYVDLARTERLLAPYIMKKGQQNEHDHH